MVSEYFFTLFAPFFNCLIMTPFISIINSRVIEYVSSHRGQSLVAQYLFASYIFGTRLNDSQFVNECVRKLILQLGLIWLIREIQKYQNV